jgi:hypothetical protein
MWFTAALGEVGNEFKRSWTEDILKRYITQLVDALATAKCLLYLQSID